MRPPRLASILEASGFAKARHRRHRRRIKRKLYKDSAHPKGWSAPFKASVAVFASSSDFMADGIIKSRLAVPI
jgi:hypothetical protein